MKDKNLAVVCRSADLGKDAESFSFSRSATGAGNRPPAREPSPFFTRYRSSEFGVVRAAAMRNVSMHYTSIRELSEAIRRRDVSPVAAVESCLARIHGANASLNAFITVLDDEALNQARTAEAEIEAGRWRGTLHGIPVAVKDFFDVAGVKTTAGCELFRDRIAVADAKVVEALKRAGAIILGKTNMDALGMATSGLTSFYGPVRNPLNVEYVTGGSSAGSAAAVAAGMCYATIDTDAVGSARLPAACCGVVGFKGSYDLVSTEGILGGEPIDDFIRWMGHSAVTARSVGDTAIVLDAVSDAQGGSPFADRHRADTTFRIGIGDNVSTSDDQRRTVSDAIAIFRGLGHSTVERSVPFGDPGNIDFTTIERDRKVIPEDAFGKVDVIVLPTLQAGVPRVKDALLNPSQAVSAENTAFANYLGLPAISIPCGFDSDGMPVGLQIVARPNEDRTVLNLAYQYEQAVSRRTS
jgi:aspartyl-tRNA(Asn)/glutamyl-tRNA(Gln) amidotransferase subunit A